MSTNGITLHWNDHLQALRQVFERLLDSNLLVDCTIAAEGQYLKAHKVILSACSPYFELLFSQENEKNPIVVLKDIKFEDLKSLIDFVYRGQIMVPEHRLRDFIDAAESLQIKGVGKSNRKNNAEREAKNSSPVRRREVCFSPISRKRVRSSSSTASEKDTHVSTLEAEIILDSDSCDSLPPIREDVMNISKPESTAPQVTATAPIPAHCLQSSQRHIETEITSSCAQPHLRVNSLLTNSPSVVKNEPEPMTEIFLPESECLVVPKDEVHIEEMPILESEEESVEEMTNDIHNQQNSNQYPVFSTLLETPDLVPDDSFLMPQKANPTTAQESLGDHAGRSPGRRRPSPSTAQSSGAPSAASVTAIVTDDESGKAADTQPAAAVQDGHLQQLKVPSPREKKLLCHSCGRRFGSTGDLKKHILTHTGERPFKCLECGKSFGRNSTLHNHRLLHTGERPFVCEECGKTFLQLAHLSAHRRTHTTERPYKCEECDESFFREYQLQCHLREHSNELPYKCDDCGMRFAYYNKFRDHRRTDCGNRPYKCEVCEKTFTHSSNFQSHQRVHLKERPFFCECGKSFTHTSTLKMHQRRYHRETLSV